jgi:FMN phosphatase YigB (HAD superfamily)
MTRALNLRYRSGSERVLKRLRGAGYTLWLITKGDLIRQAIKLSCLPFVDLFDVVEIVDRKNVASYRRVLAANHCSPSALTMVGDAFWEDVAPVVLLGGRAVHVPINRWSVIQRLESVLPTGRIGVCGHLEDVPRALAATDWANTGARAPNQA